MMLTIPTATAAAAALVPRRRIDGSVATAAEREARVRRFQTDPSIPLFLLTSQVGGLGLTLTAADRVIICESCCMRQGPVGGWVWWGVVVVGWGRVCDHL